MTQASNIRSPWPWAIVIGLVLVILVNVAMAYVAIQGRDPVVSSYRTEQR
ncbi:MAG TPA: FixH family protein [Gemmatimonadales bacterium]|jgi:hypothetical protein|nr:FixH family protein [Gemmatimonadales bacterium]